MAVLAEAGAEGGADEAAPVALALVIADASGEFCAGPPVPVGVVVDTLLEVPAVGGPGGRVCVRNGIIA